MERRFFENGCGLKAQIATLESGTFCLTRYSYNDMIMQNAVVEQHMCDTFEDALAILDKVYNGKMVEVDEAAFLRTFEIDRTEVFSLNGLFGIPLKCMRYGWTQNIIIRVGRKLYYVDIDKNCDSAYVQMYEYRKDRESFSKYAVGCSSVFCKPDAYLTRDFFENIKEIEYAQSIMRQFCGVVKA